jgi:hypothetical protein
MDQDLHTLTEQLRKNFESQEKLLGLFSGVMKQGRVHGHGNTGSRDQGKDEGWFKRARKGIDEATTTMSKFDYQTGRAASNVAGSFKLLTKDVGAASDAFQSIAKGLFGTAIGGILIGGLTKYTTGLTATYKDLAENGQGFSDGIFGMARAAMEGKMGLEEYARFAKKNSAAMAAMGGKGNGGLGNLSAAVRDGARASGQFGYTVEGLNDLVGDYMETQRLQGRLDKMTNREATSNLLQLAEDTSALSLAFGKGRKEITEQAQQALRSVGLTAKLATMTEQEAAHLGKAVSTAVTGLAAQAGEAGKLLPQMLADAVAFDGRAFNTELGKTFNAILPAASDMMGNLAKSLEGATPEQALKLQNDFVGQLKTGIEQNMNTLKTMVEAGDQNATQVLRIYQGLKPLGEQELKAAQMKARQNEAFTKLMSNLEHNWLSFSTSMLEKVFPAIEAPMKAIGRAFENFSTNGGAEKFGAVINRLGERVAAFIDGFVSPANMEKFTNGIESGLTNLLAALQSFAGDPSKDSGVLDGIRAAGKAIGEITWDNVAKAVNGVSSMILWFSDNLKTVGMAILGVVGVLGAFKLAMTAIDMAKWVKNLFSLSIQAKVVNLTGGTINGGGGRGGWGGGDGGGGRGPKGNGPHDEHGPRKGGVRGWLGKFGRVGSALGVGAGLLGGAEGVGAILGEMADTLHGKAEEHDAATKKLTEDVKTAKAKTDAVEAKKVPEVRPTEPEAGRLKATAERPVPKPETARGTTVEPSQHTATPEAAKPAGTSKLGAMTKWGGKLLSGSLKVAGVVGAVVEGLSAVSDGMTSYEKYKKGEITGGNLTEEIAQATVPRIAGLLGGIAGGFIGGTLGTAAGPVGTVAGGVAGGAAAATAAQSGAEYAVSGFFDMLKKAGIMGEANKPAATANPTPQVATLSDRASKDIQSTNETAMDTLKKLEKQGETDPEAKKTFEVMQKLLEATKESTGVNAALLNALVEAIKTGDRRLLNQISSSSS